MENKKVEFKVEDSKLIIAIDMNQDGEAVVKIEVDLKEIPDEIFSALKK